jgi:2-keto-4-pentenoate hydratase/2-oxohepta-3-ene-1,7-dioic acid hydratase in catechol pathway
VEYDSHARRWVRLGEPARPLSALTLLPPAEPSKILCIALNHGPGARAAGASAPVLLKPPTSVAGHGDCVSHPGGPWELRHEAELAAIIGVPCRRVSVTQAAAVVAGYTCANDITAYVWPADTPQPLAWAKHFDNSTPLGPWLATDLNPAEAEITCTVDGELRQHGSTRDLVRSVYEVIAQVSEHTTLLPGDVILTGTPAGSGPLAVGNQVEVSITGIGSLRNTIGAA